ASGPTRGARRRFRLCSQEGEPRAEPRSGRGCVDADRRFPFPHRLAPAIGIRQGHGLFAAPNRAPPPYQQAHPTEPWLYGLPLDGGGAVAAKLRAAAATVRPAEDRMSLRSRRARIGRAPRPVFG